MTSPEIDRPSFALHKELTARIRAEAENEMKKRTKSMSATERAKLTRLLSNINWLGDVGKAAGKVRVTRTLLDKWMNMPGVSWKINTVLNEAQAVLQCGNTAEDVLFRAKVIPELEKDAEVFRATGQRNRESKVVAKLAAQNLRGARWQIVQAANNGDKHFFIDLGRILSEEASSELWDRMDADLAELFLNEPMMSSAEAVSELINRGHSEVEENTVRQRKKRLGLARSINANRDKSSPATVTNDCARKRKLTRESDTNSGKSGHRPRKRRSAH